MSTDSTAEGSSSRTRRSDREQQKKRNPVLSFLLEIVIIVGLAILISFLVKTFLLRAFYIPSQSMESTLEVDDRIIVNQLAPGIFDLDRGDVVVFEDSRNWWSTGEQAETNIVQDTLMFLGLAPDTSAHYVVKRIVGLPGDEVSCCDDQGRIMVNGEPIDEPYIFAGNEPSDIPFDVTVPQDHIWLLGDHRLASADSRFHVNEPDQGAVPIDDVIGRSAAIIWPLDRIGRGGSDNEPFANVPQPGSAEAE